MTVPEAVRVHILEYILELTADQVKEANIAISQSDLAAIVEEAVEWARQGKEG